MALTTLTDIPAITFAGDTLLFKLSLSSYPATEWTAVYSFRSLTGSQIDITGTADGTDHLFNVGASTTAGWMPALYRGFGRVTNILDSDLSKVFWQGEFQVSRNLADEPADTDTRSWAKKCLDNIEAVLQGRASKDVINSTIAGQSIGRMTPEQLLLLRDRFKAEYEAEQDADLAAQGKPQQSNIGIRFTLP